MQSDIDTSSSSGEGERSLGVEGSLKQHVHSILCLVITNKTVKPIYKSKPVFQIYYAAELTKVRDPESQAYLENWGSFRDLVTRVEQSFSLRDQPQSRRD